MMMETKLTLMIWKNWIGWTVTSNLMKQSAARGHSSSAARGHSSSAARGHSSSATRGHSSSAARGHSSSAARGHSSSAARGHSSSAARGHSSSAARGHSSSRSMGLDVLMTPVVSLTLNQKSPPRTLPPPSAVQVHQQVSSRQSKRNEAAYYR